MKKKFLGKLLTMLLVVSMVLTLLPTSALAAWGSWDGWYWSGWSDFLNWGSGAQDDAQDDAQDNGLAGLTADGAVQADTVDNSEFLRIFHLDCGRKYFTVDQINAIIDQLAANHYTHIELAFGNDGLRFLLDDMSVTVGEKEYSSDAVTAAIKYGNTTEFDKEQKYLSASSGELSESDMGLIFQHANEKGIQIIPMMDVPGHMNAVIQAMDKLGITGSTDKVYYRCNNKGRSFNPTDTTKVDFVKALMAKYIAYFSGKNCKYFNIAGDECGFEQMDGTTYNAFISLMNDLNASIKGAGMTTMMFNDGVYNTHINADSYENKFDTDIIICYWTAGEHYATSSELAQSFNLINTYGHWYYVAGNTTSNWGGYQYALSHMSQNGCTACDGGATANTGCMLAYWCDDPSVNYDNAEAARVATYIQTLAKNNSDYFKASSTPVQPEGLTLSFGSTSLAVGGKTTVTASKGVATWESSNETVAKIKASTDKATDATLYAASEGTATITATAADGETASVDVTVTNTKTELEERTINLYVGQTYTDPQKIPGDYSGTHVTENQNVAIVTEATSAYVEGTSGKPVKQTTLVSGQKYIIGDGNGNYLKRSGNSLTNTTKPDEATEWTITQNGTSWNITDDGYYLCCISGSNWGLSLTKQSGTYTSWAYKDGSFGYDYGNYSGTYYYLYLRTSTSNSWEVAFNNTTRTGGAYTKGTPTEDGYRTTVSFKGISEGTTYVTIGNVHYTINVSKEDLSKAKTLPIQLWVTNNTIQLDNTHDGIATGTTTGNFCNGGDSHSSYPYNHGTNPHYAQYLTVKATDVFDEEAVNSDNGVPLSKCVPNEIKQRYEYNGTRWATEQSNGSSPFDLLLCKGTVLSSDNLQLIWGASQVSKGLDFHYVRYLNRTWEVSSDRVNWTAVTGNGSTGKVVGCTEQIVAYYYIQTTLTDEVTTNVVDWGDPYQGSLGSDKVLLDFAVNLGTSGRSPELSEFPINNKTLIYNCAETDTACVTKDENNNLYRRIDDIGVINTGNYEVYMITLKPTSDNPAEKLTGSSLSAIYDNEAGTEKVVWVIDQKSLELSAFNDESKWYTGPVPTGETEPTTKFDPKDTTGRYVGGDAVIPRIDIYNGQGMLVTYYLRSKATTKLTVHYVNQKSGDTFWTIEIPVKQDTYFSANFGKNADETLHDATVKTDTNKDYTVEPNLSELPQIDAQYRRINYKLVDANLGDNTDGTAKDAYLYYTFDNTESFVMDFGLPLTIEPKDVGNLKDAEIISAKVSGVSKEQAKVSVTEKGTITYELLKPLGERPDSFTVAYTGTGVAGSTQERATVDFTFYILPASNVLYEENFLTQGSEASSTTVTRHEWTETPFDATKVQQTQKVTTDESLLAGYKVFGYDDAYQNVTAAAGCWTATGLKSSSDGTKSLKTSFYGNAIDVIGSCGPNTGRVMITIKNAENKAIKSVLVHTTYKNGGTIDQVPLAHIVLGGEDANYTAIIRGYAPAETSTQSASSPLRTYSLFSASSASYDALAADLAAEGLTMNDVEVVSASEAAASAASTQRAVQTYAAAPRIAVYDGESSTGSDNTNSGDNTVTIDGFRVYRSTSNDAYKSLDNEYNVTYMNILDAVKSKITAFVDANPNEQTISVDEYEAAGGPQNEIYLLGGKNKLVQFMLVNSSGQAMPNTAIQVSLRAVSDSTTSNVTGTGALVSTTEMYYTVKSNEKGIVTITNTGSGMLAIGNVKLPAGATTKAPDEVETQLLLFAARAALNAAPVDPEPEQPTVFTPECLDASVSTIRFFRNKLVTLTVSASADVAKLTVNGRELRPTNGWLVRMGWSDTYTYVLTDTVKKNDSKTYEIIAFDAGGVASAAKTVSAN